MGPKGEVAADGTVGLGVARAAEAWWSQHFLYEGQVRKLAYGKKYRDKLLTYLKNTWMIFTPPKVDSLGQE